MYHMDHVSDVSYISCVAKVSYIYIYIYITCSMYDMYVCRRHFGPSVSFAYSAVHGHLASGLGFSRQQVSRYGIHEDLTFLRKYGNSGAHASYYMAGARMEPDAEVVLCAIRVHAPEQ